MSNLTAVQIKALVFNAVGRGAETPNFSPYQLNWAGGKSGLSVGYMQWDFAQRLVQSDTSSLFTRYNAWAGVNAATQFASEAALQQFLGQKNTDAQSAVNGTTAKNLNAYMNTVDRSGSVCLNSISRKISGYPAG